LRAIAITSVVAYHLGLPSVSGGFVGVDVFFVISGFLIVGIVHREISSNAFTFAKFYARRARRILPALFGVLLFCLAVAPFLLTPREDGDFAKSAIATIFGVSNVKFWLSTNYFSEDARYNPLLMTWSLGVEEQFYAFFPFMILLIQRTMKRWLIPALIAVVVGSFILSIVALGWKSFSFYMIPARAWELAIGAILALLEADAPVFVRLKSKAKEALGVVGLALIAIAVFGFNSATAFPGYAAIIPVAGTAFLIAAEGSLINRTVLSWRPVVGIGLVSYSWYLWHWPLLSFATILNGGPLSLPVALAVGALSLLCGAASLRFIERPFRKRVSSVGPLLGRYAVAIVVLSLPFVAVLGAHGLSRMFPPQLRTLDGQAMEGKSTPCLAGSGKSVPNVSPQCAPDPGARPVEILIGDSHASALAPGVQALANASNHVFWQMTKSSCPQTLGYTRYIPSRPGHDRQCAKYNEAVIGKIVSDPRIDTVVVSSYWGAALQGAGERYAPTPGSGVQPTDSATGLERGLTLLLDRLHAAGKRVLLVEDAPQFTFDPVRRAESRFMPLRRAYLMRVHGFGDADFSSAPVAALAADPSLAIVDRAARRDGVGVYDPHPRLCDAASCRFLDADGLLYVDPQHLSPAGAKLVLGVTSP